MIDPKLQNKSAVLLMRCSTDPQIATSLKNQSGSVEHVIHENDIQIVKTIELAGVSGSIPGARNDIEQIIELKQKGTHFDLLILPNTDRFTRAGQGHGSNIFWALEKHGITTYFVAENLFSDDRMHRIILSFMFDAAQQTAISISRGATLGNANSFLEGRSPHSRVPIYGLDRLYSVDGKAMHRLRSLADGTQQMRSPDGSEILRTFGRNVKGKMPEHYIKQKNETVRLVAGDLKQVAVVHLIFEAVHVQRRSIHSIAKQLTDSGIPSAKGLDWDWSVVRAIAFNPTYLGILRRGKETNAIYYNTAKGSPMPSDIRAAELRETPRPRTRARPAEEWLIREDPALAAFLPKHLYEIARPAVEAHMREEGKAKPLAPLSKDRHRSSDFFLKNILRSKQGGYPMTGKRSGRHGEKRYYRVARGSRCPRTANVLNRAINATGLEAEMLRVLREILLNKADLKAALSRAAQEHAKRQLPSDDRTQIEKAMKKRQRQIAAALENLSGEAELDQPIEAKLAEYRVEVGRLTAALRSTPKPKQLVDVGASADHLASELAKFGETMDDQEKSILHEMFGLLVHRMEADLLTKETEVVLAIPDWIGSAIDENGSMGLVQAFAWRTPNETHRRKGFVLAEYRCKASLVQTLCYDCKRLKRVA